MARTTHESRLSAWHRAGLGLTTSHVPTARHAMPIPTRCERSKAWNEWIKGTLLRWASEWLGLKRNGREDLAVSRPGRGMCQLRRIVVLEGGNARSGRVPSAAAERIETEYESAPMPPTTIGDNVKGREPEFGEP